MISVIKIGGNVIDDEKNLARFLDQLGGFPGKKILVHGGGKLATELSSRLGISTTMIDGRRVTDGETLKVAVMTYAGWINKTIVASLNSRGCTAIGLCGADGNVITAKKREGEIDFGFVGDPAAETVNTALLLGLLEAQLTPVIAPITHDGNGQLLNTNADTMAAVIAASLAQETDVQLIYCFEKNGVLKDVAAEDSLIATMDRALFSSLKNDGTIHKGMLPKLTAGFMARTSGVSRVVIGHAERLPELLKETNYCTTLEP